MCYITTHPPDALMVIRILLPKSNPPSRPKGDSLEVSTLVAPVSPLLLESGVPGETLAFVEGEEDNAFPILVFPE